MAAAPTTISRAPTMVTRPGAPPPVAPLPYYDYDEPPRRSIWPWLFVLGLVIALGVVSYIVYGKLQDSARVPVPNVVGLRATLAEEKLAAKGLKVHENLKPDDTIARGLVIDQDPLAGNHVPKGDTIELSVSTGKPQVDVHNEIGQQQTVAVVDLTNQGLKPVVHSVPSTEAVGVVVAQDPKSGKLAEGAVVHLNVSSGPAQVQVPDETGVSSYDSAAADLHNHGFKVLRQDVSSDQPAGTVVGQDPTGGTMVAKGATITLKVAKAPETAQVPDVTSSQEGDAKNALQQAGFKVKVVSQDTTDPNEDGLVLDQSPQGTAKPGSTVTITVGNFVADTTTTTDTTTDTIQ
jgi:serine/threonine-protein kinase